MSTINKDKKSSQTTYWLKEDAHNRISLNNKRIIITFKYKNKKKNSNNEVAIDVRTLMRKLPLDISTFSILKKSGYIYVDKTEHMYRMITQGRRYFLSRPRRFGKSLLVSTLQEILQGNKELFSDSWIDSSDYQWKKHGVIKLDFSRLTTTDTTIFNHNLCRQIEHVTDLSLKSISDKRDNPSELLEKAIHILFKQYGHVAILIDEYDSPILKLFQTPHLAQSIRDSIHQFFTTIKSLDAEIDFVFITGVSSFVKAGLFSGINNLQNITLHDEYSDICGYSDTEIDTYFKDHISAWTSQKNVDYNNLRTQLQTWYNGYSFGDNTVKVYNPFSLMNALQQKKYKNFWFESGAPTFLIKKLKEEPLLLEPEPLYASETFLGQFDIDNMPSLSLMFQAGYITIKSYDPISQLYTLAYPNYEVYASLQIYLLEVFAHISHNKAEQLSSDLFITFNNRDISSAIQLIRQLFAHVPYQLHIPQERYYHALLIMACVSAKIKCHSEYSTSHGRIDLLLEVPSTQYVIEIKFNEKPEVALDQIIERRYYERLTIDKKPIILLGLSFNRTPSKFDIAYISKEIVVNL